jgi:hypothetical protein
VLQSRWASIASQFKVDDARIDGVQMYDGNLYLFCGDYAGRSLDEEISSYPHYTDRLSLGTLDQMRVWSRYDTPQDEALAMSLALWFIDNHYESEYLNPVDATNARRYAFQNVIWEIFADGGTGAGLDFASGNYVRDEFAPGGSREAPVLWEHMTRLLGGVATSGVDAGYEPAHQVWSALDDREEFQDYLVLAERPELMEPGGVVPEPGTALLCGFALMAGALRRRRAGRQS